MQHQNSPRGLGGSEMEDLTQSVNEIPMSSSSLNRDQPAQRPNWLSTESTFWPLNLPAVHPCPAYNQNDS